MSRFDNFAYSPKCVFGQGLVGAVFEGIGVAAGSFIGGHLMESIGGSLTFRVFGVAALVLCVVHVIVQKLLEKCACFSVGGKGGREGRGEGKSGSVTDDGSEEGGGP